MRFILILRVGRVSGRSGKTYEVSWDGWDGSFELLYYCLHIHIHCFSLAINRNYPSQASHFGVKPPQVGRGSKGKFEKYRTPSGCFSLRSFRRPCRCLDQIPSRHRYTKPKPHSLPRRWSRDTSPRLASRQRQS